MPHIPGYSHIPYHRCENARYLWLGMDLSRKGDGGFRHGLQDEHLS